MSTASDDFHQALVQNERRRGHAHCANGAVPDREAAYLEDIHVVRRYANLQDGLERG